MIWQPIPNFSNYEASNEGDVRRASTGRVLKSAVCSQSGYAKLTIYNDEGQLKTVTVHRAVCAAFHGAPYPGWEARHLDGNKRNCHPGNLQWGTRKDNAADRAGHMEKNGLGYSGLRAYRRIKRPMSAEALGKFLGGPKTVKSIQAAYKIGLISKNKAIEFIRQTTPP